ncbi:MAG TPA: formylglycine-generating enzyme family protein [Nocardioidaceae bacterium]
MSSNGCCPPSRDDPRPDVKTARRPVAPPSARRERRYPGLRALTGGEFWMGTDSAEGYPEDGEGPARRVRVAAFRIAETAVTNAQFATFCKATGYVTLAEEEGWSPVFHLLAPLAPARVSSDVPWWMAVDGASWRHPRGPGSEATANHPVVHVSHDDALAYCEWAGVRLPTEAEWEFAARGGLEQARFPWGDDLLDKRGRWQANIFQGEFPLHDTAEDGFLGTAPVKSYAPNGHGLYQVAGNVWEWCGDWFTPHPHPGALTRDGHGEVVVDPTGPASGSERVMRGGSYLCHDSYCDRYRVAARSHQLPDSTSGNLGFRVASDA